MKVGVAYYPEHNPQEQWPIDYQLLIDAGIRRIRIAEFAWAFIEPSEGEYRWEWLDDAIELASDYGIEVVLCTPTACPPVWLTERYPEVLPVNKSGRTVGFGARQHRSYYSEKYKQFSYRIVRLMAERYGQHPNVAAWQLDNEFGGETKFDYGECARKAFHEYLAKKYITVDRLNESWGTVFWSQRYLRFDQIPLPAPIDSDVMMWQNPSLELEFARFSSDGIVDYAREQARILRAFTDRPITTNAFMFCWGDSVKWDELFAELDVVGIDIYSDKPHEISFYCDASRGVLSKPFWVMEYGTGSPNLALEMELARLRGCSQFYLFKMKPFPWGQEQGRGQAELVTITGEPSAGYETVRRYTGSQQAEQVVAMTNRARIGLFYHFESSWSYRISVSDRLKYAEYLTDTVYRSIFERNESIDILYRPDQISDHEVILVPLHILHDPVLEEKLISYVQNGGKLILTEDLFRKNAYNVYLTKVPRIFAELFDWKENNFVSDSIKDGKDILLRHWHGNGESWLVRRELSFEKWQQILETVLSK